jgi:hypothetical protein
VHGRLVLSPDGKEVFWNRVNFVTYDSRIMHITKKNEIWSDAEIPDFANHGITANPLFSPDGKKMFFEYRDSVGSSWITKYVEKTDSGWSEPKSGGFLLNGSSSFTSSGKVYFSDSMANKPWETGIYSANYSDTGLSNIQPLTSLINSSSIDYTPFISPNEDYLLFSSSRPTTNEEMYLYISFKNSNGTWSIPQKINSAINFSGQARFPSISPDGKYLFFCGDDGNIYWVSIQAISQLNPTGVYQKKSSPESFKLNQNYPNPFNPSTIIGYCVPVNGLVVLKVYDILGKEVATLVNEEKAAGRNEVIFDASIFASGMYFYRIQAGSFSAVKKLVFMK